MQCASRSRRLSSVDFVISNLSFVYELDHFKLLSAVITGNAGFWIVKLDMLISATLNALRFKKAGVSAYRHSTVDEVCAWLQNKIIRCVTFSGNFLPFLSRER